MLSGVVTSKNNIAGEIRSGSPALAKTTKGLLIKLPSISPTITKLILI